MNGISGISVKERIKFQINKNEINNNINYVI